MAVPVNTVAPTFTGETRVGRTLTGANGTWTNTPNSFAYQWQAAEIVTVGGKPMTVEGEIVTWPWEDIVGATSQTYEIGSYGTHMIRLRVIASNGDGAGNAAFAVQDGPVLAGAAAVADAANAAVMEPQYLSLAESLGGSLFDDEV